MTPEEERKLRAWAIERVLTQYTGRWGECIIQDLLRKHGSPRAAYKNMSPDDSFHLGNYGCFSDQGSVDCRQSAKSGEIHAWRGRHVWGRPDLVITWLEVFEHVAGYGEQLTLF